MLPSFSLMAYLMIINPESYRDRPGRDWWPHRSATPVLLQSSQLPNHGQIWAHRVGVKGKHESSPVAWVFHIGQLCDHNLWLHHFTQCWPLYRGVALSLLSQLTSLSLVIVFVCSHTSSYIQMVCLAGEIIWPGQSFHQWTHLGEETSAHLGPFAAHGDRIINSRSEIMADVLSLKQLLRVKPRRQ